jgi:hypothetical protein
MKRLRKQSRERRLAKRQVTLENKRPSLADIPWTRESLLTDNPIENIDHNNLRNYTGTLLEKHAIKEIEEAMGPVMSRFIGAPITEGSKHRIADTIRRAIGNVALKLDCYCHVDDITFNDHMGAVEAHVSIRRSENSYEEPIRLHVHSEF